MQSLLACSGTPTLPFRQWLSFPAVALISGSGSPFQQYLPFPAVSPLSSSGSSFLSGSGSSYLSGSGSPYLSGSGCFPMVLHCSAPASKSFPMELRHGAPASNKPHPAEKSTPVWLAIWRTWAGFANSQLLPDAAALSSMQGLPRSDNFSAQTSASLHPPAALRLRVLTFTRTWSSTVCAEEFPTPLEMSLHGLNLLRQTQICRPICTDCLRHLRISAE